MENPPLKKQERRTMVPELYQHGCTKELLSHVVYHVCWFLEAFVVWFSSSCFCFSGFLGMLPLYVLDQAQLTWLTHGKTASLKMRKKHTTRVACSANLEGLTNHILLVDWWIGGLVLWWFGGLVVCGRLSVHHIMQVNNEHLAQRFCRLTSNPGVQKI